LFSIKEQLIRMTRINTEFEYVNTDIYRRFLVDKKIAKYEHFEKEKKNENSNETKETRILILRLLLEFYLSDYFILFFDESLINHFSFKKRIWKTQKIDQKTKAKVSFKSIRIMALITQDEFISMQITSHSNSECVYNFLRQSILWIIQNKTSKRILLFLDNATSNRSEKIRALKDEFCIQIMYNAPATPYLNLAEHYFEFIKRDLRLSFFESDYKTVKILVKNARFFSQSQIRSGMQKEIFNFFKILRRDQF
jgi:hypothetical protein